MGVSELFQIFTICINLFPFFRIENGYQTCPEKWLESVLNLLTNKLENDHVYTNLCATRRSAGLPFMVQAILVSEPKSLQSNVFDNCMETLLEIAENNKDENEKSRTHSLNILRALFKHNQLNERVIIYVPRGFMVAIIGFDNSNWTVRWLSNISPF